MAGPAHGRHHPWIHGGGINQQIIIDISKSSFACEYLFRYKYWHLKATEIEMTWHAHATLFYILFSSVLCPDEAAWLHECIFSV